ncbi:Putative membrane spanning protein (plasmid) [Borrelia crocidurae DOU]|uniref:Putative membrane spanning protein n=1 Tax=Borrelia crocidurae DOU TaxID=1293575 RepID=W5SKL7_9SPIR|nr:virulence associated lipoprotein [Borrelia crocidurae]AHH07452.1 Putative membrane spanning protein [Borrelia crocidurae DOU]
MKRKNFILFRIFIFILISILLVSCGPTKYFPIASVIKRRKEDGASQKLPFGVVLKALTDPLKPIVPLVDSLVDDETLVQRMYKEREIEEIKGDIPFGLEKILKMHDHVGTEINDKLIILQFHGYFLVKTFSYLVGKEKWLVRAEYPVGALSTLFWDLTYDDSLEYLEGDNFELLKEFYLALEYNDYLFSPFVYVYGKLSYFKRNTDEVLKLKNNIVKRLRNYAKAYYIDVYQSLLTKKDKLDKLSLKNVRFLKSKLNELELAKQELRTNIIQQFVDGCRQYVLSSIDSKHDVWPHLRDTFNEDFDTKCDDVIRHALDIKNFLDNIQ